MTQSPLRPIVGRTAHDGPPNRFESTHCEPDFEHLEHDPSLADQRRVVPTQFLPDRSQSIIASNDSPDIPFRYSINPYRGCEHGCAYCYARPTHEMLGMNAGLDFESKILVKHDAPTLLRSALARPAWRGELIAISGVTDCYQPAERQFRLTRSLLEVMLEARQCLAIVTKNALVVRDLDLLAPMAAMRLAQVNVSLTTLDDQLARTMEPRTSTPAARLEAVRRLAAAGVPVRVLAAPIIPGLNDHEIAAVLQAAARAGARAAGYQLLRLPLSVEPVFRAWLAQNYPDKQDRVEALIRATRGGKLSDARFGARMRGEGTYARQIKQSFQVFVRKFGLDAPLPEFDFTQFRRPRAPSAQMELF